MTITASLVKELRQKTGAGMMDCKKALVEANADFEIAIDWLRTKGLAAAAKRSSRAATEGLAAVFVENNIGAVVEINSETDFVAKNKQFQSLVHNIAKTAIATHNLESLNAAHMPSGKEVQEEILNNISTIGENIQLRRMKRLQVKHGIITSYVHNSVENNMGKIAVLVAIESTGDKVKLQEVGKQIAMHIAAAKPECLDTDNVPTELIQREKDIFTEQSKASGKPDNIIEKMISGRIRRFIEEIVLLEQTFLINGKDKVSTVISNLEKELGTEVKLVAYVRFELGEGITA